jgi:hypothetical protein
MAHKPEVSVTLRGRRIADTALNLLLNQVSEAQYRCQAYVTVPQTFTETIAEAAHSFVHV